MGLEPIFLFVMHRASKTLVNLVRGVVEPMGYELVGVEYLAGYQGGNLLRVYIDTEEGVQLEDCTAVSHQLSGLLDVEDPIPGEYNLEVSSPGLDRPLFEKAHFERYVGHRVNIKLGPGSQGRRKYKGLLKGMDGETILLEVDDELYHLAFDSVDSARLIPEL